MEAPVDIVPYDASWPGRFEEEEKGLRRPLAAWLVGPIEHIGSTAIPGLVAKPVIDMMAGVESLDASRPAIAFRDYLRSHSQIAAEYGDLKQRLAQEYRFDREAYTEAKGPFIARITALALEGKRAIDER
jgi:GrpB-like predicted nucleotidyltransferase (UPF0157 family)